MAATHRYPLVPTKNLALTLSRIHDMVAMVHLGSAEFPCTPEDAARGWKAEWWDTATLIKAARIKAAEGFYPHLMQRFIAVWQARF